MEEKALLIDVSKCMGCRGCMVSCKQWNQLPAEVTKNTGSYENPPTLTPNTYTRIIFKEIEENGKVKWLFRKEQCMHCNDAACIKMCPVDARSKDEYGFTEIDKEKCIGCGVCTAACPFKVPQTDPKTYKSTGCWFCLDRVVNGLTPACAKTCPTGAVQFGDRKELLDKAKKIVADSQKTDEKLYLYGAKEFGGLHVMYILEEGPGVYDLPKEGAAANKFEMYAYLEEKLNKSPMKDAVLTAAALKYFGNVHV